MAQRKAPGTTGEVNLCKGQALQPLTIDNFRDDINVSGTPTSFDPQASDPTTGGGVFAVAVYGSTVYAAGFFTSIGGQTRNLIAGLNSSDGTATSFDPNGAPGFGAFALAVASDGTLYAGGSFDTFDLAYQQGFAQFSPILKLIGVVSRKTHGSLTPPPTGPGDLTLNLDPTTAATIEPRSGGNPSGDHTLVFTFANTLNAPGATSITATASTGGDPQNVSASGSLGTGTHQNEYTVSLTGVPNGSHVSVTLHGVSDLAGNSGDIAPVRMDVLYGDVNQSGRVDGTDVSLVRQQNFQTVNDNAGTSNYLEDINISGRIDGTDVSIARQQNFSVLPPP